MKSLPVRIFRLITVIAVASVAFAFLSSPAHAAQGQITGTTRDSQGKPLPNVGWEIYELRDGQWTTMPFGPKLADSKGRFSHRVPIGKPYRVCFHDSYYGGTSAFELWKTEVRQKDRC